MKKVTLIVCLLAFVTIGSAQNCPTIVSGDFTPGTPGNIVLTLNYQASGTKHFRVSLYCGAPITANLVSSTCVTVHGNGTYSTSFACGSNPNAVIIPYTGSCNVGTNCDTVRIGDGGPLPLRMTNFFIKRNSNKVSLSWETHDEINIKEFQVQRLMNGEYNTISTVNATNNANGSNYAFSEENGSKQPSMYRLKIMEQDGKFAYSDIRSVKGVGNVDFVVFPNPTSGKATVSVTDVSEPTDLQVIDNAGRIIQVMDITNQNSVSINKLQKGMYIIRLVNKNTGEASTRKLSVIN